MSNLQLRQYQLSGQTTVQLYEKHGFKEFKRGRAGHLESVFYELELE